MFDHERCIHFGAPKLEMLMSPVYSIVYLQSLCGIYCNAACASSQDDARFRDLEGLSWTARLQLYKADRGIIRSSYSISTTAAVNCEIDRARP